MVTGATDGIGLALAKEIAAKGVNVVLVSRRCVCVAVCCSVLQFVAVSCSVLQCLAVCCSVLQCVAVCCSVLQLALDKDIAAKDGNVVRGCCSVLQRVAVCCSALQCVPVWCSVLQCVAVYCN